MGWATGWLDLGHELLKRLDVRVGLRCLALGEIAPRPDQIARRVVEGELLAQHLGLGLQDAAPGVLPLALVGGLGW